jgi:hypothetical protein
MPAPALLANNPEAPESHPAIVRSNYVATAEPFPRQRPSGMHCASTVAFNSFVGTTVGVATPGRSGQAPGLPYQRQAFVHVALEHRNIGLLGGEEFE